MKKILLSLALACFGITASSYAQSILSQDFSGAAFPALPTGWTMTTTGPTGAGWKTTNGSTDLYFGTVSTDATHAAYAVVNDYSTATPGNDPALLTSPTFSLASVANPYLTFDYQFFQAYLNGTPDTIEQAWVEISTNAGATWTLVDSMRASSGWTSDYKSLATWAGSASCILRFHYTDNGADIIGAAVTNINVFNAQANDIQLVTVAPYDGDPTNDFVAVGSGATFAGIVRNLSPTTMTSFSVSYQVAAAAPVVTTFSSLSIAPMATYTFTCTSYTDGVAGRQPVQLWATVAGDPVLTNDSAKTGIYAYNTAPSKVFAFEEGTGMWCGYCVRGIVFMDSLEKNDSQYVNIIAVHDKINGTDALASENTLTTDYDTYVSNSPGFTGYPGVLLDRRYVIDPSDALTDFNQLANNTFGFADITTKFKISGGKIYDTATVTPGLPMSGDYRLALVISEDKVHNASYYQHNYYSSSYTGGGAGPLYGVGFNFQDSVFSIPGSSLYFNFVARYSVPDFHTTPGGVAGSLPATMTSGTAYTYGFAPVTIPSDWNQANLRATVFLIDNNAGNTNMQILNSSGHVSPLYHVGVTNTAQSVEGLNIYPNPAQNIVHATFNLNQTDMVNFAIYDALGHKIFSVPAETMQAGMQQINFSVADLASGVYNVSITTANGVITKGLSVVK